MPGNYLLVALSLLALFLVIGITWGLPPQKGSVPFAPPPVSREVMEANKKAALEFYDLAINKKDYAAASKYLGLTTDSTIRLSATAKRDSESSSACLRGTFRKRIAR